jgi:D-alanine transaminase
MATSPIVYLNGRFVPREEALVPVEDRGYQFADGIYEVVLLWQGRYRFLDRHLERLVASAAGIELELPFDAEGFRRVAEELLSRDGRRDGALYLQVTRGVAPRDHAFPDASTPTVVAYLKEVAPPGPAAQAGVPVAVLPDERWARCSIKSVALLPNVLAKEQARRRGAKEAVLVRDGVVTEGASSNVFAVVDGVLRTHPADAAILNGVTRQVVLEVAPRLGIPVREEPIRVEELFRAEELFYTSTTCHVQPIARVDARELGAAGPITRRLQEAYWEELLADGSPVSLTGGEERGGPR